MDLAERFSEVRRAHPLKFRSSGDPGASEFAFEIISNHATLYEPDWEGFQVDSKGHSEALKDPDLKDIRDRVRNARSAANHFTHWNLAKRTSTKVPLLVKVDGNFLKTNISVFDWNVARWAKDSTIITPTHLEKLDKLHRLVLWKSIFIDNYPIRNPNFISLVFGFKAEETVLGIWNIHGRGRTWVDKINSLIDENANYESLHNNLWPLMIFLGSSVAARLAQFTDLTDDLTRLAYNSLRPHSHTLNEIAMEDAIHTGTINSSAIAEALNITKRCNIAMGQDRYYETTFKFILAVLEKRHNVKFSSDFLQKLCREFVCWHLASRATGEVNFGEEYIKQIADLVHNRNEEDLVLKFWKDHCDQLCISETWHQRPNAPIIIESLKKLIFVEPLENPGEKEER